MIKYLLIALIAGVAAAIILGIVIKAQAAKTAIIVDTFTAAAYQPGGFYDFYCTKYLISDKFCAIHNVECYDSCLTMAASINNTASLLTLETIKVRLFWPDLLTDQQVTLHPELLQKYEKIIMLHNEYATQTEFDAVTKHSKVIYLFPNTFYGKIEYNDTAKTMHLIRGHFYPTLQDVNGFNWTHENTNIEANGDCIDWHFEKIENNSMMLNCYPEHDDKDGKPILADNNFYSQINDL